MTTVLVILGLGFSVAFIVVIAAVMISGVDDE